MAQAAQAALAMAAIYVITSGQLTIEEDDGTKVEKGKGGKVKLTPDEVKALPSGVTVELLEERQARLEAMLAAPGLQGPVVGLDLPSASVVQGVSEETLERFIGAVDRFEAAVGKLVDAMSDPDPAGDAEADKSASKDEGGDTKPASKSSKSSDTAKA